MGNTPAVRGRILVVEDHAGVRESLAALLDYEGYQVDRAANGQEAFNHLRRGPLPDLILLDLMMPVMDGWEFRQQQQQDPKLAAVPVVVFSGRVNVERSADTLDAHGCLTKPMDVERLLALVGRFCS